MPIKENTQKRIIKRKQDPDLKDIVKAAIDYLKRVMNVENVLLEEVEHSEDGLYWLITLSHENLSKEKRKRTLSDYVTIPIDRSYKVIKINKQDSTIESMKIREI